MVFPGMRKRGGRRGSDTQNDWETNQKDLRRQQNRRDRGRFDQHRRPESIEKLTGRRSVSEGIDGLGGAGEGIVRTRLGALLSGSLVAALG